MQKLWVIEVAKLSLAHKELQIFNGMAVSGQRKSGWSIQDTANKFNLSFGKVAQDLSLAEALRHYPELGELDKSKALLQMKLCKPQTMYKEEEDILICGTYDKLKELPNDYTLCYMNDLRFDLLTKIFMHMSSDSFLLFDTNFMAWPEALIECKLAGFNISPYPIILIHPAQLSQTRWRPRLDYKMLALAVKGSPTLLTQNTSVWDGRSGLLEKIAVRGKILVFGIGTNYNIFFQARHLGWNFGVIDPSENKINELKRLLGVI